MTLISKKRKSGLCFQRTFLTTKLQREVTWKIIQSLRKRWVNNSSEKWHCFSNRCRDICGTDKTPSQRKNTTSLLFWGQWPQHPRRHPARLYGISVCEDSLREDGRKKRPPPGTILTKPWTWIPSRVLTADTFTGNMGEMLANVTGSSKNRFSTAQVLCGSQFDQPQEETGT